MSNDIFKDLNPRCKKYVNNAFNMAEQKYMHDEEKFAWAFIFSIGNLDKDIKKLIDKYKNYYNITYSGNDYPNKQTKSTSFYKEYKSIWQAHIKGLMQYISNIKKHYSFDKNIMASDVEPFMVFDYFYSYANMSEIDSHLEEYTKIAKMISNKKKDIIDALEDESKKGNKISHEYFKIAFFQELMLLMNDKYKEYFKKLNKDKFLSSEIREKAFKKGNDMSITFRCVTFSYIDGKYYLISNYSDNKLILENDVQVDLPAVCEITKINTDAPSMQRILNIYKDMDTVGIVTLELVDENGKIYKARFKSSLLLGEENDITKDKNVSQKQIQNNRRYEFLNKYGRNMVTEEYLKDPSIGRDEELKKIYQMLLYPERDKSIIITGPAGSGKTALVKGLAYRIKNNMVPSKLKDLSIYRLNISDLVAGTKYVGTLEEKMTNILNEARNNKNIILYIDEIHQAMGAGTSEKNDNSISEILKPYIDYGDIRIIASTTEDEYLEYVSRDQAFKTRFKRIQIDEPNYDVLYGILEDLIIKYNQISTAKIKQENMEFVINWLIESTDKKHRKYNDQNNNPRLILDIIKYAYAIAEYNNDTEVKAEYLIEAISGEDRIYDSTKEAQIEKISHLTTTRKNNIIKFTLKK